MLYSNRIMKTYPFKNQQGLEWVIKFKHLQSAATYIEAVVILFHFHQRKPRIANTVHKIMKHFFTLIPKKFHHIKSSFQDNTAIKNNDNLVYSLPISK